MTVLATHAEKAGTGEGGTVPAQHRDHARVSVLFVCISDHDQRQRSFVRLDCH